MYKNQTNDIYNYNIKGSFAQCIILALLNGWPMGIVFQTDFWLDFFCLFSKSFSKVWFHSRIVGRGMTFYD